MRVFSVRTLYSCCVSTRRLSCSPTPRTSGRTPKMSQQISYTFDFTEERNCMPADTPMSNLIGGQSGSNRGDRDRNPGMQNGSQKEWQPRKHRAISTFISTTASRTMHRSMRSVSPRVSENSDRMKGKNPKSRDTRYRSSFSPEPLLNLASSCFIIYDNLPGSRLTKVEKHMPHISFIRSFCVFFVLAFLCSASSAQSQAFFFDDKASFEKASQRARTIDFEAVAPAKGFGKYAPDVGLNVDGIRFRTSGGARFGSGTIYVPSAHYIALNPGLKMLDGAHLSWGAPNQPGNAHMELTFPGGVNAVGADIWSSQPVVSQIEMTVTTRDGRTHTSTITTKKRPDSTFAGFISE